MEIKIDSFNSEIFGMGMYNLVLDEGEVIDKWTLEQVELKVQEEGGRHISVKVSSTDKHNLNAVLAQEYKLVDTLVEYYFDKNKSKLPSFEYKFELRDAKKEDVDALKNIAREAFEKDRFHSDVCLDNSLCDQYYEKWIENSYFGFAEKVIVAEHNGEVAGFTTGKTYVDKNRGKLGRVDLSAVSRYHRGIGIYTNLIHKEASWYLKGRDDVQGIMIGTQLDNLAVQKTWVGFGFVMCGSKYVLHKKLESRD